jgi:hypothetical protein
LAELPGSMSANSCEHFNFLITMIIQAIRYGIGRSWQLKEILLLFLGINLSLSLLFITPYLKTFSDFFSNRLAGLVLVKTNLYLYYSEFYYYMKADILSDKQFVLAGAVCYYLFSLVFSGGLLCFLGNNQVVRWPIFFKESWNYLWRMLKFALLLVIFLFMVTLVDLLIILPLTNFLPKPFIEDVYFWFYCGACVFILSNWLLMILLFDISRVILVENDYRSIILAFLKSIRFFYSNPVKIIYLNLLLIILFTALSFIYWFLQKYIPNSNVWGVLFGFCLLQITIYFQYLIKFARYGAILKFYRVLVHDRC